MGTELNENDFESKEECEKIRKAVTKYGVTVVCDEEEEAAANAPDLVLPGGEGCENVKKVASKLGYQVVCDEE